MLSHRFAGSVKIFNAGDLNLLTPASNDWLGPKEGAAPELDGPLADLSEPELLNSLRANYSGGRRLPTDLCMTSARAGALRTAMRVAFSPRSEAFARVDIRIARLMASAIWGLGGVFTALLLPLSPPTVAIGWAGWPIVLAALVLCVLMALWRSDENRHVSLDALLMTPYLGVALVVIVEWLAGGREAPYHHLFLLPVLYAAAIQPIGRFAVFLIAAALGSAVPLLYERDVELTAANVAGQILIILVLAAATRLLIGTVRSQRQDLRVSREEAARLARIDPLTGLGNRRAYEEALEAATARAERSGSPLSLAMGDVVRFKAINDELGHVEGDEYLCKIASCLTSAARAGDECFRWGGDEFVALLPDTSAEEARTVSERLERAIAAGCELPDGRTIETRWGIAEVGEGLSPAEVLAAADRGLVRRKDAQA